MQQGVQERVSTRNRGYRDRASTRNRGWGGGSEEATGGVEESQQKEQGVQERWASRSNDL